MGTIKVKRGEKSRLPQSASLGELLYCTDTNELYVGQGDSIDKLDSKQEVADITDRLDAEINCVYIESFDKVAPEVDDTNRLQRAIDNACDSNMTLACKTSTVLHISNTVSITKPFYINLYNAIIRSSADVGLSINVPNAPTQSYIKNIMIDCTDNRIGMSVNAKRVYLKNISFFNITNIGLSLDGGYEIDVSQCNFKGISPTNKAIVINTTDNYISHCYGTDNNVFIENNADGNVIESCHAWIYTTKILPNSIFIDFKVSGIAEKCISDTYYISFKCKTNGSSRVVNNNCIINTEFYNHNTYSEPPIFIFFDGDGPVYKTTIVNNWVTFPSKELTGYSIPGKFYNIDRIKVLSEVYGNTGSVSCTNLVKVKLDPVGDNISTKQSYAIRKNNRVSLKCIFAFNGSVPSTDTVVFKLPEYMRPFQNTYMYGAMGTNIDNLSKIVHCFIDSDGNVKVKNSSSDSTMSQGMITCEFDVWQPGLA